MNDDLSDEAFMGWYQPADDGDYPTSDAAWQECRRRAMEVIEIKDKALKLVHSLHQEELEKERRKAFEAGMYSMAYPGHIFSTDHIEVAYRAFLKEREDVTK